MGASRYPDRSNEPSFMMAGRFGQSHGRAPGPSPGARDKCAGGLALGRTGSARFEPGPSMPPSTDGGALEVRRERDCPYPTDSTTNLRGPVDGHYALWLRFATESSVQALTQAEG